MNTSPCSNAIVIFACFLILVTYIEAKPFNLNKAIAEELALKNSKSNQTVKFSNNTSSVQSAKNLVYHPQVEVRLYINKQQEVETTSVKSIHKKPATAPTTTKYQLFKTAKRDPERISLKSLLEPKGFEKSTKLRDFLESQRKKLTPLKYRKLFQIELPLKPKKLNVYKAFSKRNQAIKRETSDGKFNKKYIPLLRSLSLLVDNLLASDSHEHRDSNRRDHDNSQSDPFVCPCDESHADSTSQETAASTSTVTLTLPPPPSKTTPATTTTNHPPSRHFSRLRQNKVLPVLSAGNTASSRRNHHGIGKGSGAPRDGSVERDITGDYRDSKHDTRSKGGDADAADYEENTGSTPRDGATSDGPVRRDGDSSRSTDSRGTEDDYQTTEIATTTDPTGDIRGVFQELEVENQLEDSRDEEEHSNDVRGRLRRLLPKDQIGDIAESVQPEENSEKSVFSIGDHIASHQRFFDGNGTFATEIKNFRPANETVISLRRADPAFLQNIIKNKAMVIIIDGYSVTRDKNGENKITEKSIIVQS